MIPPWLHVLAIAMLGLGFACAILIAIDVARHPQHMSIMNVVWPISALYGGPLALWGYWRYGRLARHDLAGPATAKGETPPHKSRTPFAAKVGKGASHCGAGCTLGDIIAEWLVFAFPAIATLFGLGWLFEEKIFAVWVFDYLCAFVIGIGFQYATIVPMRGLPPGKGLWEAVKVDTLSLTSWQLGMYGFMAIAHFVVFGRILGVELSVASVEFWAVMQIAMLCGFATAYPMNWWLIRRGIKEAM